MKTTFRLVSITILTVAALLASSYALAAGSAELDFDISLYRTYLTDAPPFLEKDASKYTEPIDAIQVKVKTAGARGAGSRAKVYLSICGIDMHLGREDGSEFLNGDTEYFTLLFARPGKNDSVLFGSYPYGYLKFCDIKVWNDAAGREPGWFADYIRIYFHNKNEGWFKTGISHGWYRYASKVHFFEESRHWTSEYKYPYNRSAPAFMQYFGTWNEGNKWLAIVNGSCPRCDLSYTDLQKAVFSGGDFTKANFTGANLRGAKLTGANLDGAIFAKADLSETILDGRDFTGANFRAAKFDGASLKNTTLDSADLGEAAAFQSDFSGARFYKTVLNNSSFISCNFSGSHFSSTKFFSPESLKLGRANFSNSDMSNTKLVAADLTECLLSGVDFSGADLSAARLGRPLRFLNVKSSVHTICPNENPGPCEW